MLLTVVFSIILWFRNLFTNSTLRQEMIRRYPDQEATMGEARLVGETGPDQAGNRLSPTTIKVRVHYLLIYSILLFVIC